MKTHKLSNDKIGKLKPRDKMCNVGDGGGLYLRIKPTGAKSFYFAYRIGGRRREMGLGSWPSMTVENARLLRAEAYLLIKRGLDPIDERHKTRDAARAEKAIAVEAVADKANTFEVVYHGWLELGQKAKRWRPRTEKLVRSIFEDYLMPHIGDMPIKSITPDTVLEVLQNIATKGRTDRQGNRTHARSRGNPNIAVQAKGYLAELLMHGGNPHAFGLKDRLKAIKAPKAKRKPQYSEPELRGIMSGLRNYLHTHAGRAAYVLGLAVCRGNELLHSEWSWVDWDQQTLNIPGEYMKTGETHVVYLPDQAIEVLRRQHEETGNKRLIFPPICRHANGKHDVSNTLSLASVRELLKAVAPKGFGPHSFRHAFMTIAGDSEDLKIREFAHFEIIESQLAHAVGSEVSRRYNKAKYAAQRRGLAQAYANVVCFMSDDVVRLAA